MNGDTKVLAVSKNRNKEKEKDTTVDKNEGKEATESPRDLRRGKTGYMVTTLVTAQIMTAGTMTAGTVTTAPLRRFSSINTCREGLLNF